MRETQETADALVAQAKLGGRVGFAVADVATGKRLEQGDPELGQPPASVAKALTAAYGLDILGPEFRFETQVVATGSVKDGVVQGDLILVGGGDPTLNTDDLAGLATKLKQAGITAITGDFKVWGGGAASCSGHR